MWVATDENYMEALRSRSNSSECQRIYERTRGSWRWHCGRNASSGDHLFFLARGNSILPTSAVNTAAAHQCAPVFTTSLWKRTSI